MYKLLIVVLLGFGALGGYFYSTQNTQQSFGDFNPSGGTTYRLQASIGSTDTTIRLSSFKEPGSNIPYTMTYLNSSIEYGTLDPQTSTREFIRFTGITQNSNGTATLTGVTRGIANTPAATGADCTTASSTLRRAHAGQSIFILSDSPCLFAEYAVKRNAETISGIWTYSSTSPPRLDQPAAQAGGSPIATTSEFATIKYVLSTTLSGAATAAEGVKGIVDLATALQQASSTSSGVSSSQLVLQSKYATDTPQRGCAVGYSATAGAGCTVIAQLTGKIRQTFINLAESYTWTAAHTFSNVVSIAASVSFPITLNTLSYTFPSSRAASSTSLMEDGSGNLHFYPLPIVPITVGAGSTSSSNSTTTLATIKIPANTLSVSGNYVELVANYAQNGASICYTDIGIGTGSATSTFFFAPYGASASGGGDSVNVLDLTVFATSTSGVGASANLSYGINGVTNPHSAPASAGKAMGVVANSGIIYVSLGSRSPSSTSCSVDFFSAATHNF